MGKENELRSEEVSEKTLNVLDKAASKTKQEILDNIIRKMDTGDKQETENYKEIIEATKEVQSNRSRLAEVMEVMAMDKMVNRFGGGDGGDTEFLKEILKMMKTGYIMKTIAPIMNPPQEQGNSYKDFLEYQKYTGGDTDGKTMEKFIEYQQKADDRRAKETEASMAQLKELIYGKQLQDIKRDVEDTRQQGQDRFLEAIEKLEDAVKTKPAGITEEMEKATKFVDTISDAAKKFGFVKESAITDQKGKVNWGELTNKVITTAETIAKAAFEKPPQPAQIQYVDEKTGQPITPEQLQQLAAQQTVHHPPQNPEINLAGQEPAEATQPEPERKESFLPGQVYQDKDLAQKPAETTQPEGTPQEATGRVRDERGRYIKKDISKEDQQ